MSKSATPSEREPKAKEDAEPTPAELEIEDNEDSKPKLDKDAEAKEAEREAKDKEAKAKEDAEQAALPYKWTQTLKEVDITIATDAKFKGKDIVAKITKTKLFVSLKGPEGEKNPFIDGEFPEPIDVDESTWWLAPTPNGKNIVVHLEKSGNPGWWAHVVTNAPKIDTTKIVPENSRLDELDGETRSMVEKMMYDQDMKRQGKLPSDEQKKFDMLEKFKKQHPEMDFSKVKMT